MIVPDVNLLLYANNPVAKEHTIARNWVEAVLTGNEIVGFCWPVICAFLRIITNSRAISDPLTMEEAIELVNDWISRENVVVLSPSNRHWVLLSGLLRVARIKGAMTSDAEIATYAIENNATLYTADRGFSRFPDLKFVNPL